VSDLIGEFEQTINDQKLFQPHQFILVAVSGGLDSTVLIHIIHRLAESRDWMPVVAHYNHQLRGSSSNADESFVRKLAEQLGLKFVSERGDVRQFSREHKLSIEMAARHLRHEFLARTSAMLGINTVALGHHADDQIELFFLRLLRGAGGEGLTGMKWIGPSPHNANIRLVRPLLRISKAALEAYAKRERIRFREDATNAQIDCERNRIRRELLPLLRAQYQPALTKTIQRTMEIVGAEAGLVRQLAEQWQPSDLSIPFQQLHSAVQRQVIHRELLKMGIPPDFELIERLRCCPGQTFMVDPALGISLDDRGTICSHRLSSVEFKSERSCLELTGRMGEIVFGGLKIAWAIRRMKSLSRAIRPRATQVECFDADRIGRAIILRHWQAGDRFQPIGMNRSVKLQNLLTNAKIPREDRHHLVVATTQKGELFWVEGLRLSARFKLDKETTSLLKWSWQRDQIEPQTKGILKDRVKVCNA
jgi:tRNA(Ile)-lysidine synthase